MDTSLLSAVFLRVAIDFAFIAGFWGQGVLLIHLCIQGQVLPFIKSHSGDTVAICNKKQGGVRFYH